jgi:tRNA threonylcarbamoyl adenosine modification protein (Sua5/YciO/YrdC/YwlC family)
VSALRAASVRDALDSAAIAITASGSTTPRLDTELLLAHALGVDRTALFLDPEREVGGQAARAFQTLARRRAVERAPVAYLLGRRGFRRLELAVDPRVLIPRPETELLVEIGLELPHGAGVVDVGTGSGAVALALKDERPDLDVVGTDVSAAALDVARGNAGRLGLDVAFVEGDLLEGAGATRRDSAGSPDAASAPGPPEAVPALAVPDAVLSNPPYVADGDPLPPGRSPPRAADRPARRAGRARRHPPPRARRRGERDAPAGPRGRCRPDARRERPRSRRGLRRRGNAVRPRGHRARGGRPPVTLTAQDASTFERCMAVGGLAVFPADTVYGVACDPNAKEAVQRLYLLKRRAAAKPAAILFFALDLALEALPELGPRTRGALEALLPGGFTLLVPNPAERWPLACGPDPTTMGLRVPALPPSLVALQTVRRPVMQSSANTSGGSDARRLSDVPAALCEAADLVLDGGELPGTPSTVLDLREFEATAQWTIVREGAVEAATIDGALSAL